MTHIRASLLCAIFLITALLSASPGARASVFGPDMPSWGDTGQDRASDASNASHASNAPSTPAAAPSDPLDPIRARLAAADALLQAGKNEDAQAALDAAESALKALPSDVSGTDALRDQIKSLREKSSKPKDKDEQASAKDADDDSGPSRLGGVHAERNERVDKWIDYYTGRGRDVFQKWLTRSGSYMDLLTRNLRAEGVPEELANLVFVESGFNMHARSVARAVGPWQFIRGTAKILGLKMTPYVDQRRDPELSTRAAAKYLRRLYDMFNGNWPLALAAYNSGEGTVQRAIKKQGTDDYWSLHLPRETEEYVPQFLAAMEIASNPERYGFELPPNSPFRFDEVLIHGPVDLKLVSKVTAIPIEELTLLNPMFQRHRAPAGPGGTPIRVPKGRGDDVQTVLQTKYHPRPLSRAELREAARAQRAELRHASRRGHHRAKGRGAHHVVRRGETLSQIGKRYGKSPEMLARLNRIPDSAHLRAGQKIRVR